MKKTALFLMTLFLLSNLSLASNPSTADATGSPAGSVSFPHVIRFAGTLPDSSGVAVTLTFALYKDQTDGKALWQEVQTVTPDSNGRYTVLLGSTQPEGLPADLFSANEARWLGVASEGQQEMPRILLVSVPYALKAGDAETLGGKPLSAFMLNPAEGTETAADVIAPIAPASPKTPVAMDVSSSTGTTNQLTKWTDATDLGNSIIFDNGTEIGIGTNTPAGTLDVNANTSSIIFRTFSPEFITTKTFGPQFDFENAASPTPAHWRFGIPGFANATQFFIFDYANSYAPFTMEQGAGANALYFKAGGNVGVGTSTPSSKLTVKGTVQSTTGGFMFPDNSTQTSAATVTALTAGTGISVNTTSGNATVGLNTSYLNSNYAQLGTVNTFTGNQSVTGNVSASGTVTGATLTSTGAVNGASVTATGALSSATLSTGSIGATGLTSSGPVSATTLAAIDASTTSNSVAIAGQETSTSNVTYGVQGTVSSSVGIGVQGNGPNAGVQGNATASSGTTEAVGGYATSPDGVGVHGRVTTSGGGGSGVYGETVGGGNGVLGVSFGTTGSTNGVYGYTNSPAGIGAIGINEAAKNTSTTSPAIGVLGDSPVNQGLAIGVKGFVTGDTLNTSVDIGVQGISTVTTGSVVGVQGNVASSGASIGVQGISGASVAQSGGAGGVFTNTGGGDILLGFGSSGGASRVFRVDNSGAVYGNGAFNTSGADFAESFEVSGTKAAYQPGDVLMIDETGTRRLALSNEPYSTKVAGVYATKPGVLASPYGIDDPRRDNGVPLAVVGVVPCKVSAENGAIHAGDLLVTASRPGFAMKGTDRQKMLGAVVGKALGSLESGTGVIEVLVSLH